jgi:hypothetical protein
LFDRPTHRYFVRIIDLNAQQSWICYVNDIQEKIIDYYVEASFPTCPELADLFTREVFDQAGIEIHPGSRRAKCSPPREKPGAPRGQTDVGLYIASGATESVLLVENKIFSPFTYRQPERYGEEADWLMRFGGFAHAIPVLLCPKRYRDRSSIGASKFPVCVTYEQLAVKLPTQQSRDAVFKAIERCATGLITVEIPAVSSNFEGYKILLEKMRPDIKMLTSAQNKGQRARTVRFTVELHDGSWTGDSQITLLHQWHERRVKILLDGSRQRADWRELAHRMRRDGLNLGLTLDPNDSKSIGLFLRTPPIVNDGAWDGQIEAATSGIENVGRLADWLRENTATWQKWRS